MSNTILPIHALTGRPAVGWRKARRGETGEQPIWPIAGGAEDDDAGDDGDDDADKGDDTGTEDDADEGDPEGADKLGDAGKRALDSMKARLRDEKAKRRTAEAERDTLRTGAKKDGEPTADEIRAEARKEATDKANARIIRSEIRAAAAGKLADPKDALVYLDLSKFEVDEDGEIDSEDIVEAIDDLIKNKPYLAAATAKRFQGTGDGGAARKSGTPKQLTESDLKTMTADQIVKAQADGRLATLLGAG